MKNSAHMKRDNFFVQHVPDYDGGDACILMVVMLRIRQMVLI
ncbi:hypothetical protein X474_02860 [Dethiosulfatarculus sandiegensis]|uniref:Uncharacterized protein n=1 Tax=Dethiosulfatarculus sandiegensis TaxID=1429043 RepID=A0A0D2K233_9BACT|nr:hypothetical protein X474_02860 [Dethiosulfatarculus sandiegensis]